MSDSRTAEVNRTLAKRRALMERRVRLGRILLAAWLVLAALNLVLLFGSRNLRLPISCTTADFLMMIRFLYPDMKGGTLLSLLAMLLPAVILLAAVLWKSEKGAVLRTVVFLLLWADVVAIVATWLWNPAILFGENSIQHLIAIGNLVSHILLIWWVSRARRAVTSLEILPETEYEGDPFEEFTKNK